MKLTILSVLAGAVFATSAIAGELPAAPLTSAQLAVNAANVRVELARTYPALSELDFYQLNRTGAGSESAGGPVAK